MKKATILFTGGHHNSALLVALALKKQGYHIIWMGHKFTSGNNKSLSAEFQEIQKYHIRFLELKTGKFYRIKNPLEYFKIFFGFIQAFVYLVKVKPKLIISFGGYLAVPPVIIGFFLGIPSITHEQTATVGWANKIIAVFSKKIMLTHQSSAKNFPKAKTVFTGLPVAKKIFTLKPVKFKPPLLFITCGKQGSHIINQTIFELIPQLAKQFTIIHQTGPGPDLEKARRLKKKLNHLSKHYLVSAYFFGDQYLKYLKSASLIISRSGAHTAYKIALLHKRSILIPIPWVSHNEQYLNAKLSQKYAPITILTETALTPKSLLSAINKTLKLPLRRTLKKSLSTNALDKILQVVGEFV
jgi:UDP-N-acetylglucosamine--N-acetylmuramyl-(pentapeptide) pyrophosphoryl-undecaprenol N-acetylglucosamine transferase